MSSNVPARTLVLVGKSGPAFIGRASVEVLGASLGAHGTVGTAAPSHLPRSGQPYGVAGAIGNLMLVTDDQPWSPCDDRFCGASACPSYAFGDN